MNWSGLPSIAAIALLRGFAVSVLAAIAPCALLAQAGDVSASPDGGLLGDDFARDTGAIIVTAERMNDGNLFESVATPKDSCLANAPRVGASDPGFAIDANGLTKVSQLERIRRQTRAGTIFISGGNFAGADFRKARLYNMCFFGTDLSQTDWSGLSAAGLGFVEVDLTGAQMTNANLPDVLFRNSKLGLVNAKGARWKQGRLDGGWVGSMRGLDLTNADLTDFRIVCGNSADDGCPTDRDGIIMKGANLRRASLHAWFVGELSLAGARIDQTELGLDHLRLLEDAQLVGPIVLRSPRRAVMLFPTEVKQLAEVAEASDAAAAVCADPGAPEAAPGGAQGAVTVLCAIPGSEPRDLLRSVTLLESLSAATAGYEERRRSWTAERDACLDFANPDEQVTCITAAYRGRQGALRKALGLPGWLAAPGYRLFLSREAAFPTDKAEPGLYGRILPVLLDSAVAAVIVRSHGAGRADVRGIALDGCGFEAKALVYDVEHAQLGFAGRRRRGVPVPFESPLIAFAGRSATVMEAGLAQASATCGPDNPYPQLEEIELDERLLSDIWDRF